MRILLDENIDPAFADLLPLHEVRTVSQMGWSGVKNGELLQKADATFDVFISKDLGIPHQQNLTRYRLRFVILKLNSQRFEALRSLVDPVMAAVDSCPTGEHLVVSQVRPNNLAS